MNNKLDLENDASAHRFAEEHESHIVFGGYIVVCPKHGGFGPYPDAATAEDHAASSQLMSAGLDDACEYLVLPLLTNR